MTAVTRGDSPVARAVAHVAAGSAGPPLDPHLRVTLHFHPDLPFRGGLAIDALLEDGRYRSQFETRTGKRGAHRPPGRGPMELGD